MNIAYSILSAAATVQSAASAAEAGASGGIIDRIQALGTASEQIKDPDYWGSVGIITVTGILIVFFILALLIFFFWLMGTIFKGVDKRKNAKAEAAKAAKATAAPAPAPVAVEEAAEDGADSDEEIMAVISAAIAAYAEEEGTSYTIRNVKRRDSRTRSAWSLAGIGENTRPF